MQQCKICNIKQIYIKNTSDECSIAFRFVMCIKTSGITSFGHFDNQNYFQRFILEANLTLFMKNIIIPTNNKIRLTSQKGLVIVKISTLQSQFDNTILNKTVTYVD